MKDSIYFMVGNGADISVWEDPWIPSIQGFKPSPNPMSSDSLGMVKVADLIDPASGNWNRPPIWSIFSPSHAATILKINLSHTSRRDSLVWTYEKSSRFSVRSLYRELVKPRTLYTMPLDAAWWKKLWKMKVHERLKTARGRFYGMRSLL